MNNTSDKAAKFQNNRILLEILFFQNSMPITGAVTPAIISKFLPSKVINSGIMPYRNNLRRIISIGNLIQCKNVLNLLFLTFKMKFLCFGKSLKVKTIILNLLMYRLISKLSSHRIATCQLKMS